MKSINLKRLILPNLPYLLFVFLFDKAAQAARLAPGADLSGKLLSIGDGFAAAFSSFAPSLHPADLLVGVLGAALIRLVVYVKSKNAKKYRRGKEFGSARWGSADGTADDEQPPVAAEVRTEQKRAGGGRQRKRQNPLFRQAQPDADAQQLSRV